MAEQEACAELVEKATTEATMKESSGTVHGESLLLPLLQGLLDNPETDQPTDSGTESGEDLRSGLIIEVQSALDKLTASLKSPSTNIGEERRDSLLQLVNRLQAGLCCQLTPSSSSERRSSLQGAKFSKKKRPNRHTVGVTSEELEDARRLMEEIAYQGNMTGSGQNSNRETPLQKQNSEEDADEDAVQDSETDDDSSTVKTKEEVIEEDKPKSPQHQIQPQNQMQPQPDLILQTNPIYNKPADEENISDNDEYPAQLNEKANRFNNKKLKMKRANTIDIPKPLKYYEYDDEDSENEDVNSRRNNYLALRGPIRIGKLNVDNKIPEFEPKTESDKKFMAFLGKQTDTNSNKTSAWSNQQNRNVSNWNNKFGNIKNNFEKVQTSNSINSARNFWKSADDTISVGKTSYIGPKISRQSARNLQQMFEEKQKQSQQQYSDTKAKPQQYDNKNIVTGSLKVDTKSNKNIAVMTQPNAINKFSHAPMSAFKPVHKVYEPPSPKSNFLKPKPLHIPEAKSDNSKTLEAPLFLYSPKNISPEETSPVHFTPWAAGKNENRVLSIAASRFEKKDIVEPNAMAPRRMSKEKITIPQSLTQNQQQDKLTAPYLVKSVGQSSSVRKLSGQYDSMGTKDVYRPHEPKSRVFVPGENYTIRYNNPVSQPKPPPKVYNAEYTITQKYYNAPKVNERTQQYYDKPKVNEGKQQYPDKPKAVDRNAEDIHQFQPVRAQENHDSLIELHNQRQLYKSQNSPIGNQTDDVHNYTQPKLCNEPAKMVDDYQYTSSLQFHPQGKQVTFSKDEDRRDRIDDDGLDYRANENLGHQSKYHPHAHDEEQNYHVDILNMPYQHGPQYRTESHNKPHSHNVAPQNVEHKNYEANSSVKSVTYGRQTSNESVKEYTAVSSKVMSGPVSQQAVTVQNSPKNRNQHDMEYSLKATLQKFSSPQDNKERKTSLPKSPALERKTSFKDENTPPPLVVFNNVNQRPSLRVNDKPLSLESLEINERGESVLTSKFHIPVKQVLSPPIGGGHELSKSESWHQIANKPSPRASPSSRSVTRSKSSHTLAVPKQFEAGMSKTEMLEKKKTMEAYFGASMSQKGESKKLSSINRVKTSQKISTQRQNSGLCRSKTLPDIVCSDKLDDHSIDAIFEDIFNSSTS